ncbi:Transcriptional Coactivator p15 (PC4) [Bradyrhizobium erythrophlei]|jgi:hypothetical protein|nr:Transcriptional Coactivator p15 (PC4) [Bradyrhizobium erythrophlei]
MKPPSRTTATGVLTSSGNTTNNYNVPDQAALAQASAPDQAGNANILSEPITVARFWRNRRRDEMIAVRLKEYKGHPLVDVRTYFTDRNGCMQPTTKGIVLGVSRLPELASAIVKAEAKARSLGLLIGSSDEGGVP